MAYMRPDESRPYIYMNTDGTLILDNCTSIPIPIKLWADKDVSHEIGITLFIAVSDYLTQEGFFDPDMLESSAERYRAMSVLLQQFQNGSVND